MIVTCPACSSRYKLDESKVTARGAKITCPKCKHVFVVYPGGTTGPLPDVVGDSPRASKPPNLASTMAAALEQGAPADNEWDDEPTRIGMQKVPDLRRPANPTLALPMEPPPFTITPAEAAARSPSLDFKKVGVSTWKVKIKIGLIYDFSDIKTLRKYIQDGRVTTQDVISYDGKIWRGLHEIPDLDVFFVQTWEELAKIKAAEPAEHVATPPKKPATGESSDPPKTEPPKPTGPTTSPFRDPFAQKQPPKKAPVAPKKPVKEESNNLVYALGGLVVLAAVAAGWWFTQGPGAPHVPPPQAAVVGPAPKDDSVKKLEDDLRLKMQHVDPVTPPPPTADDDGGDGRIYRPPHAPNGAVPVAPGQNVQPQNPVQPPHPANQSGSGANPPTAAASGGTHDANSSDMLAAADDAARRGDWAGAVSGYQQVVQAAPTAGNYHKLGNAQLKAGQKDDALASLAQAASKGMTSDYKICGDIAKENGDNPGASGYYQKYLKTNPKDKADIEAIVKSLSGG